MLKKRNIRHIRSIDVNTPFYAQSHYLPIMIHWCSHHGECQPGCTQNAFEVCGTRSERIRNVNGTHAEQNFWASETSIEITRRHRTTAGRGERSTESQLNVFDEFRIQDFYIFQNFHTSCNLSFYTSRCDWALRWLPIMWALCQETCSTMQIVALYNCKKWPNTYQ